MRYTNIFEKKRKKCAHACACRKKVVTLRPILKITLIMKRILYVLALLSATVLVSCEKSSGGGGGGGGGGGTSGGGGSSATVSGSAPWNDQTPRWWVGVPTGEAIYGYMDATGKMVIPAECVDVNNFSSGVARVIRNDQIQFIDKDGKSIGDFPATYYPDDYFYYDRLWVQDPNTNLLGLMDKQFNLTVPAKYKELGYCGDNGYCWCSSDGNLYGFVDRDGKEVIPAQYVFCYTFSGGVNSVGVAQANGDTLYGIINSAGEYLLEPQAMFLESINDGFFAYWVNGYCGLMDKNGNRLTEAVYTYLWEFSDGMVCFNKDGKLGYLNQQGTELVPATYYNSRDYESGYCWVLKSDDDPWELIDKKGNVVYALPKANLYPDQSRNGLTKVLLSWTDDSKTAVNLEYIDFKGNVIYSWVEPYSASSAPMRKMLNKATGRAPRDNKDCTPRR